MRKLIHMMTLLTITFCSYQANAEDVCEKAKYLCRENGGTPVLIASTIEDCSKFRKKKKYCNEKKYCVTPCKKSSSNCLRACSRLSGSKKKKCEKKCKEKKRNCSKICKNYKKHCVKAAKKTSAFKTCKKSKDELGKHLIRGAICTISIWIGNWKGCVKDRLKSWGDCFKYSKACLDETKD